MIQVAESGDAADDEEQLADHRRHAEVDEDGGERAVDVERDRLEPRPDGVLEGAGEADAVAGEAGVLRQ